MNTYFVKVNERSGEYEYTDDWLVDAHDRADADKQIHQIMLNYRGRAEYDEETSEYDYGEHISYVQDTVEVRQSDVHSLRKYIMTLSPDAYGVFVDMVNQHGEHKTLCIEDWDSIFTQVEHPTQEGEFSYHQHFPEDAEYLNMCLDPRSPYLVWEIVEEGEQLFMSLSSDTLNPDAICFCVSDNPVGCEIEDFMGAKVLWRTLNND